MADAPDPAQVAERIKGMDDAQITEEMGKVGIDTTLKQIFGGMVDSFVPDKAGSTAAVIQYEIETEEGTKNWNVDIGEGKCATSEGTAENPRLTLQLKLPDFVRLIFGQADGTQLFMGGKLKLKGDMMFGMQMQNFFERRF